MRSGVGVPLGGMRKRDGLYEALSVQQSDVADKDSTTHM